MDERNKIIFLFPVRSMSLSSGLQRGCVCHEVLFIWEMKSHICVLTRLDTDPDQPPVIGGAATVLALHKSHSRGYKHVCIPCAFPNSASTVTKHSVSQGTQYRAFSCSSGRRGAVKQNLCTIKIGFMPHMNNFFQVSKTERERTHSKHLTTYLSCRCSSKMQQFH